MLVKFLSIFPDGRCSILWGAEIRLRAAVITLRRGEVVTVMAVLVVVVVVVLWGGVVVVMVTLDVAVGEEEGGRGRRRLQGGRKARRQSSVALNGAVPTRRGQLGSGGEEAERWIEKKREEGDNRHQVKTHPKYFYRGW